MAVSIELARSLTYQAAESVDNNQNDIKLAAMAKLEATDVAMKVVTESIALLGAKGLQPNLLLEKIFRDAKAGQIYEGTNQIQRMVIARHILK